MSMTEPSEITKQEEKDDDECNKNNNKKEMKCLIYMSRVSFTSSLLFSDDRNLIDKT